LPAYCVPQKAYDIGRNGSTVNEVCPAEDMPALQRANKKGKRYYELTQDIRRARDSISVNESRLVTEKNKKVRGALVRENRALNREIRLLELRRGRFDRL